MLIQVVAWLVLLLAVEAAGKVAWTPARFGGYGPLPGAAGPVLEQGGDVATSHGWRGRRQDATGLYNLGARHYDPRTGRFLSPDPLGHAASASLYDFAHGDPVNGFDPDGRFGKGWGILDADRAMGRNAGAPDLLHYLRLEAESWVAPPEDQWWPDEFGGHVPPYVTNTFTGEVRYTPGPPGMEDMSLDVLGLLVTPPVVNTGAAYVIRAVGSVSGRASAMASGWLGRGAEGVVIESQAAIRARVLANIAGNS